MLIVLYGSTGRVGSASRQYFRERGFEVVKKINYMPDTHLLKARYEARQSATVQDVQECDFVYKYPDGTMIGFNKSQIIDAVWGRKNCLITFATQTTDFIEQIKMAYGDFATVIGVYIEKNSLQQLYSELDGITPQELDVRMAIADNVAKNMSNKRELFDDIVIYNGEEGAFDTSALYAQYDGIIKKALAKEKEYRDKNYVPLPYTGSDPYVFISYAHADAEKVYPVLSRLQLERCRIWFDAGISAGQNWRRMIASKIESQDCKNFILFISENSVQSVDVEAEINAALALKKNIIPVQLDDAKLDTNIAMYLYPLHHLKYDDALPANILKALDPTAILNN